MVPPADVMMRWILRLGSAYDRLRYHACATERRSWGLICAMPWEVFTSM